MFSLWLKFLLSCLCRKVRRESGPIVSRLSGRLWSGSERGERDELEAEEEADKF